MDGKAFPGFAAPTTYTLHLTAATVAAKGVVTSFDWWRFTPAANAHMRARIRVAAWFDTSPTGGVISVQIGVGGVFPTGFGAPGVGVGLTNGNGPSVPQQFGIMGPTFGATDEAWTNDGSLVGAQQLVIRLATDGATHLSDYVVGDVTVEVELYYPAAVTITP